MKEAEGTKSMPMLLLQFMSDEPTTVHSLPWVAHGVVAASLAAGVIMWLSGGKLLKPLFAFLGGVAGGAVGFVALPTATAAVFNVPSPYVGFEIGRAHV